MAGAMDAGQETDETFGDDAGDLLPGYALGGEDSDFGDEDWDDYGDDAMPRPLFGQDDAIADGIDDDSLPSITEQLMRKKTPGEPLFPTQIAGDDDDDGEDEGAHESDDDWDEPVEPAGFASEEPFELTAAFEPEAGNADVEAQGEPADEAETPADIELSLPDADEDLGLYDALAVAREMAQAARSSEDRTRNALYAAVGRAYDFSIAAQESPEDFEELVAENGLTVQDRAPMTPVVKLVFGADYDKTRLTEYAAALSHGHRLGVERGKLADFLSEAEGGLKGVVTAERRLRREEAGKPVEPVDGPRAALAKKLRAIAPLGFEDLAEDGPEFGLVMIRRTETGEIVVLGEVPEDIPLIEKAARKLVA